MLQRATLLAITLFWAVMNVLLWRSEYGGRNHAGSAVPLAAVWRKILTAADSSTLEIMHHGKKMGYCRWTASTGAETVAAAARETGPEGMIERPSDYRLNFDGSAELGGLTNRLSFDLGLRLDASQAWQDFHARLNLRPSLWEVHVNSGDENLHLKTEDEDGKTEQAIPLTDLQNPAALARDLDLPLPPGLLDGFGMAAPGKTAPPPAALKWESRNDWIKIGHNLVRVYRVEARLLERFKAVVIVSQAGEILRVELPDDFVLVNDQLTTL